MRFATYVMLLGAAAAQDLFLQEEHRALFETPGSVTTTAVTTSEPETKPAETETKPADTETQTAAPKEDTTLAPSASSTDDVKNKS